MAKPQTIAIGMAEDCCVDGSIRELYVNNKKYNMPLQRVILHGYGMGGCDCLGIGAGGHGVFTNIIYRTSGVGA